MASARPVMLAALVAAATATGASTETARGAEAAVESGALRVTVRSDPWQIELTERGGATVRESAATRLGARFLGGWSRAVRARELRREGEAVLATAVTGDGREIRVRVRPDGEGAIALEAVLAGGGADALGIGFEAPPGERYFGFGSRSDAVDHAGREVENYVADGPTRPEDRNYPRAFVPPWAHGERDDSTYYPVPWLLSSRGYGVLVDRNETSRFKLGSERPGTWSVEADAAGLSLRFFAGPRPADALARFTAATGRQPPPPTPWTFGPWFQTGQPNRVELAEEAALVRTLRDADAPVSAAETQMHFLPCGAQRDDPAYNRGRTRAFHAAGLAHLVYFNPALCVSYQPLWTEAAQAGVLQRERTGVPHVYPAFVGGSGPLGFTTEPLSQFDFTASGTERFYERLVREATDSGHDGFMEDFGESTSPLVVAADGTAGTAAHNRYPTDYHCALDRIARRTGRPVVRFQRSGWTGSARCAVNVWGGDPTTVFGFDGLQSAVRQALGMGLSGVTRFGTDIGGYNTYGPAENLTPELLARWIEFGAVSGVMRTKRSGIAVPSYQRPQIYDRATLPVWRRYAKLHTQLYPYILAADAHYRRTGMPLMRHLGLVHPGDERALRTDEQLLFGPDLLAAPVVAAGERERKLYAPAGRWVDLWRSASYDESDGSLRLGRPRVLAGGTEHRLPAPLDELPLLVRAGAVLPLLEPDVDTLADYGSGPGLVHLNDRRGRLRLLAFPRGRSSAEMFEGERLVSVEGAKRRRWTLAVRGARKRTYRVQATLRTLRRPFTPCRVTVGRRTLARSRWSYDTKTTVLRARFKARRAKLTALPC